jgi:hypothetical protein
MPAGPRSVHYCQVRLVTSEQRIVLAVDCRALGIYAGAWGIMAQERVVGCHVRASRDRCWSSLGARRCCAGSGCWSSRRSRQPRLGC